jgi:signal transduction histidine kinase
LPSLKRRILGKPKIVHKGLAIVLLPLALNLGLVLLLDRSLDRATHWMERTRRNGVVIIGLAQCLFTTTGILTVGTNTMMHQSYAVLGPMVEGLLNQLERQLDVLEPHTTAEMGFSRMHKDLATLVASQRAIFVKNEEPTEDTDSLPVQIMRAKKWTKMAALQSNLLQQALARCEEQFRLTAEQEMEAQQKTEIFVGIGLMINLLLAFALAYFFNRNISGRVNILIRNARKIPLYEPIRERVGGYDELTEVGNALRAASHETRAAAEYRRSLMQMMSHDLRSPLAAGKISIEILEHYKGVPAAPPDQEDIRNISRGLDNCLDLIGDLLLLERLESGYSDLTLELENVRELVDSEIQMRRQHFAGENLTFVNSTPQEYMEVDREQILLVLKKFLTYVVEQYLSQNSGQEGQLVGDGTVRLAGVVNTSTLRIDINTSPPLLPASLSAIAASIEQEEIIEISPSRLSMFICKQIIAAHGGSIGVDAVAAALWFTLPIQAEAGRD